MPTAQIVTATQTLNNWIFFLELLALVSGALLATYRICEWLGDRAVAKFVQQRDSARVIQIEDRRRLNAICVREAK